MKGPMKNIVLLWGDWIFSGVGIAILNSRTKQTVKSVWKVEARFLTKWYREGASRRAPEIDTGVEPEVPV